MACVQFVRESFLECLTGGHDTVVLSDLEVLDARPGWVRTRLKLKPHHLNGHGTTHGGCVMTLVDTVTWLALITFGMPYGGSVSTNMSADFVRPSGQLGDELIAEGEAISQGKRLGFTRVTFYVNGKVTGTGQHTMALWPKPYTHKFSDDGKVAIPVAAAKL